MIVLQIEFRVAPEHVGTFIDMYREVYAPALRRQLGYGGSRLIQLFPREELQAIDAEVTKFNLQLELLFDTEELRRRWAQSDEHAHVWSIAISGCEEAIWRGYVVAAHDPQPDHKEENA